MMMKRYLTSPLTQYSPTALLTVAFLLISLILTGCTAELIAPYDEATVSGVTALLKKTDTFLLKMDRLLDATGGAEEAKYEKQMAFYDDIRVDLSVIRARAAAIPQNTRTVEQLDELGAGITTLEQLHKTGLTKDTIKTSRQIITELIERILAAEFTKKRQ